MKLKNKRDLKAIKAFFKFINYYRYFIKDFTKIAKLLYNLLFKDFLKI